MAVTGDVMLGRLVDEHVICNPTVPPAALWGDVLPLLLLADLRLVNLECVISANGREWRPYAKAFHFRAHPRAVEFLKAAKIDCVTLANNHVLDYGLEALRDCLELLDRAGLKRTGAGTNVKWALEPAFAGVSGSRVGVLALTDNEPEWEASETKPGIAYVAYDRRGIREPYRTRIAEAMERARNEADFLIVSAHVGPNWGVPSAEIRTLAHELLDLGADLYWGHSNHTPQGIELDHGKVILYSCGDFVDDYMVDQRERNDLSFLFLVDVKDGHVGRIDLHPVRIENCRVRLARDQEVAFLRKSMQAKCAAFGTIVTYEGHIGSIAVT